MSDVPAEQAAEATPEAPAERTVPYDRFAEVNRKAKEKDDQLKALTDRLEELEAQGKSESEQERLKREKAEAKLAEMQADLQSRDERLNRMEKSGWVRNAAAQAGFANPDDAVAFADLDGLEEAKDADKAIKDLAKQRPYLLRQETPGQQLGQVVTDGRPGAPPQQLDPAEQARQEGEQFVQEMKDALNRGKVSTPGLLDR
jgi:DNA repair exonuclease SbcCD ATPase subunit